MEWILIFLLAVVTLLAFRLWVRRRANGSCLQIFDQLRYRIRSGLGVVSIHEFEAVQENLLRLVQQVPARLAHLEKAVEKFSHEPEKCPQEISPPVFRFERSVPFGPEIDVSVLRPRSIVWRGLRFTLSDSIWVHIGMTSREDLDDGQIQSMVQGPFCRVCLKRLVVRDRVHAATVPAQCRHCGLFWRNEDGQSLPISLLDLKGQVFENLDRTFRTNPRVSC